MIDTNLDGLEMELLLIMLVCHCWLIILQCTHPFDDKPSQELNCILCSWSLYVVGSYPFLLFILELEVGSLVCASL